MPDDEMPFSLDWLAGATAKKEALSVCQQGHLVVNNNTHWEAARFSADLRALWCRLVAPHEEPT